VTYLYLSEVGLHPTPIVVFLFVLLSQQLADLFYTIFYSFSLQRVLLTINMNEGDVRLDQFLVEFGQTDAHLLDLRVVFVAFDGVLGLAGDVF
jgi:hypothetical protein